MTPAGRTQAFALIPAGIPPLLLLGVWFRALQGLPHPTPPPASCVEWEGRSHHAGWQVTVGPQAGKKGLQHILSVLLEAHG